MSKLLSLCFYVAAGGLSAILAGLAQRRGRKLFLLLAILLLSLVAGFRGMNVGVDTETYSRLLYYTQSLHFSNVTTEHLFYYTGVFLLNLFGKMWAVFLAFALLINALVFLRLWDYRDSISLSAAVLLYVLYYFGGTMNGLRQYIAIAIIFFSTRYLEKQQYFRFLALVLISVFFHRSAVVACVFPLLYIFPQRAYTPKQLAILGAALVSVPICAVFFILNYYGYYAENDGASLGSMSIVRLGILGLSYLLFRNNVQMEAAPPGGGSRNTEPFVFIFSVTLIGDILGLASMFVSYASRAGYYFRIFELVFFGAVFHSGQISKSLRFALFLVLLALGAYSLWTYNGIVPYSISYS